MHAGIPACRDVAQTGCVIAYAAFREEIPPPDHSRFGRATTEGHEAVCVNPAALRGNVTLDAYLASGSTGIAEGNRAHRIRRSAHQRHRDQNL